MIAILFALAAAPPAPEAPPAPASPPVDTPDIVVVGRGLAVPPGDRAYDIVTIDRQRLTGTASGRLEDVLRDAAGFQQFRRSDSRSAQPTSQGATLRGLGGNASSRALVTLDGVPQVDPFGGWVSFPAYDPIRLGQVRVTRGGGSGTAGPGALAGTIELSSIGPRDLTGLAATAAYGSRDSIDLDAVAAGTLGSGYGFVGASYARGDGFIPIVRESRGPVDRAANYAQGSVAARAVFPVGASSELQATGLMFHDARDRGTDFTENRNTGADASLRLVGRGAWGYEALAYAQIRKFESGFATINAARSTVIASLSQYNVPATGIGGRIELRPPVGDGITVRIGSDVRATDGETKELYSYVAAAPTRRREAGGRTATLGGFVEASWEPDPRLTLTAGGRADRWWIRDGSLHETVLASGATLTNTAFADRHGWEPTGRGGIAWVAGETVTLRTAAYLGWRLPTLNELYRPFRVGADATAGNAALSPERSRGVDGGIDWRPVAGVKLGATAFWNRLDDAIANVTLGNGPGTFPVVGFVAAGGVYRMRGNLDAIRSRGVEVDGEARIGAVRVAASYAYVDARVRASGTALSLDGLRPAQTPEHQASGTIGWARGGYRLSGTVRYVSAQYEDDQNSRVLRDAVTLDALVAVPVAGRLSFEARAENLTNTRVEAGNSGANVIERATPRTLWIGLRYGV